MTDHSSGNEALRVDWVGPSHIGTFPKLAAAAPLAVAPRDLVTVEDMDRAARVVRGQHADGRKKPPAQLTVVDVK